MVSALGFGCMRLPTSDGKPMSRKIDIEKSSRMLRSAIDLGVNYLDTAYGYHGGASERFLGKFLDEGFRDQVKVATKSPVWLINGPKDFDAHLKEQLRRLRTDHIDFYLFHALNGKVWKDKVLKHRLLERAEAAVDDGRIGHLGFSFHDDLRAFKTIIDGYDGWSFCQIQYNYMDTDNQAGTKGLRYAHSKGLAVVVMEPLLGGRLANPPKAIRSIIKGDSRATSPADLALRWIWNQPEVSVVLSGMGTLRQVKGNLESADNSRIGSLKRCESKLIERIKKAYEGLVPIPCTKCGYCMPCPHGVDIPRNFENLNNGVMHDDLKGARAEYVRFIKKKEKAGACVQCRKCEKKCPQGIPISRWMPEIHAILGEGKRYAGLPAA
jgi:hypothetical protein